MGWASAGAIFDPVARALLYLGASEEIKRKVLGPLIDALQEGDWDTEHESLERFQRDPVIVSLFYQRDVGGEIDGVNVVGKIDCDEDAAEWTLTCFSSRRGAGQAHGELCRSLFDVVGHDSLVQLWAEHDRDHHGGTGEVATWALIDRPEDEESESEAVAGR